MSETPSLKRSISLPLLTFYGLGNILGAGIYILIGEVAGVSAMYMPAAFLVSALLAAFTALSYAELSARFPVSAGEAVFVQQGFGQAWLSRLTGLLIAIIGVVSAAAIARGFVGYLDFFVQLPDDLVIVLILVAMGGVAVWGISESVRTAALFTLLEIGGLLLVVWVAAPALTRLPDELPNMLPGMDWGDWRIILPGAFLAFYAFIGFEDMVNVAEEVKQPQRTMPAAIIIALTITTVLYVAVATVSILTVPLEKLAHNDAPLALVYGYATGSEPALISLISLFAVINGALIQIIMASRILYGMARRGWLPAVLARVHPGTRTPINSTLVVTGSITCLALWFPLVTLANATSFIVLSVFSLVNLSLLRLKMNSPKPVDIRLYPWWVPLCGFMFSAGFLLYAALNAIFS